MLGLKETVVQMAKANGVMIRACVEKGWWACVEEGIGVWSEGQEEARTTKEDVEDTSREGEQDYWFGEGVFFLLSLSFWPRTPRYFTCSNNNNACHHHGNVIVGSLPCVSKIICAVVDFDWLLFVFGEVRGQGDLLNIAFQPVKGCSLGAKG